MIDTKGMITVSEAARRLRRSEEQVRRNLRSGKLKGQRIGHQWFVDETCLTKADDEDKNYLIPREFIRRVYYLRDKIREETAGRDLDVDEMLRRSREGR